jgi:hypothetical protein
MTLSSSALLPLAQIMGLDATSAIALPTVMETCARKVGTTQDFIFHEALSNAPLRNYIAGICRSVMVAA